MKKLSELYNIDSDVEIKDIKINSKEVEPGDLFVCTKGVTADRHDFIPDAIKNGASALVVSKDVDTSIPTVKVEDTNKELPLLCSRFYNHPEDKLYMIGVTGTDGKTSVTTIVQTLLGNDICAYMGTNGRSCAKFNKDTGNTTPDSDKLYKYFDEFVKAGCKYMAMETSSEAFFRGRLTNLRYKIGAITNITREHLNIHGSFENYIDCKCQLFRQIDSDGYAILNKDDELYNEVLKNCNCTVLTYGKDEDNTLQIKDFTVRPDKTLITYRYDNKDYDIISPLLGDFNVYNLACAILICIATGKSFEESVKNIDNINVSGRLDMLPNIGQKFYVMVDYAHTPNGISKLLNFVHTLDINRSIVVIGSAGERDYLKRPLMGKTVVDNASYAIFTYEDPRSEEPIDIINMMISEIKDNHTNFEVVVDRSSAIKRAIDMARDNDIVLILGKGNETYQKLKNETIYFNDIEEAMKYLKERVEREKVKVS